MQYVALLRGINVGGHRKVDMKQLRATFERAGMRDVRTWINSGNVIFRSESAGVPRLRRLLESAIESSFGFPVKVILRDAEAIRALVRAIPEGWMSGPDTRCEVVFLSEDVDTEDILGKLAIRTDVDEVRYEPGAVLWRVDRSRASRSGMLKLVGTELYANMTIRNCNTARKLNELLDSSRRGGPRMR